MAYTAAPDCNAMREVSCRICELREDIRANRVSFPLPVPSFAHQYRPDMQWRVAELYFLHAWTPAQLAKRYRVGQTRIRQTIRDWVRCAMKLGYLQLIPADGLSPAELVNLPPAHISSTLSESHRHA